MKAVIYVAYYKNYIDGYSLPEALSEEETKKVINELQNGSTDAREKLILMLTIPDKSSDQLER